MKNEEIKIEEELNKLNATISRDQKKQLIPEPEILVAREMKRLDLERQLGDLRGDEYAEPLNFELTVGFDWYSFASFSGDAHLVCNLDKDYAPYQSVIFRFIDSVETKFGGLNDEIIEEHYLYGKGLGLCGFFVVRNSNWKKITKEAMKKHTFYNAKLWSKINHYLFRDKGGDFACLASSIEYCLSQKKVSEFTNVFSMDKGEIKRLSIED